MNVPFFIVVVLLLGTCPAVGQNVSSVGFKGINLGMTREQVNQVIRDSEWKYIWGGNRDGNESDTSTDFVVTLTGETDSFKEFSCVTQTSTRNCAAFTTIDIHYFEGKVMAIYVKTNDWESEYATIVKDYVEAAMAGLQKKFGKPSSVRKIIDRIDNETLRGLDEEIYYVAEWDKNSGKGKSKKNITSVSLYISKSPVDSKIAITISMYDMPALIKSQKSETVEAKF